MGIAPGRGENKKYLKPPPSDGIQYSPKKMGIFHAVMSVPPPAPTFTLHSTAATKAAAGAQQACRRHVYPPGNESNISHLEERKTIFKHTLVWGY